VALAAFVVSALIGKFDRLAGLLLALYILLMAALVHLPHALQGTDPNEVVNIFRNFIAAGGRPHVCRGLRPGPAAELLSASRFQAHGNSPRPLNLFCLAMNSILTA
jgi:hypothetical protein